MGKERILYIGGFELPDKNAAAQRVIANAKAFRELGHEVIFYGVTKNGDINDKFNFEGFDYYNYAYPSSTFGWFKYIVSIPSKDFIERIKPSIIIAYNYPAVALYRLARYCKSHNIKLVVDVTEWYAVSGFSPRALIHRLDISFRMKYVQKRVDGVIAISRLLYDYYKNDVKTIIVPPLVDLKMDKWAINRSKFVNKPINIVYAGCPGIKDRLDIIIDALSEYENIKFTVIGITSQNYEIIYNKQLPKDNRVEFCGRLSHVETLNIIQQSDFQIFFREKTLSNMAGFPTKLAESISAGVPVITNNTSNIHEFIENGVNGFILSDISFSSIKLILEKVMEMNDDEILTMKTNCLTSRLFDYNLYIKRFNDFIVNL